MKFIIPFSVVVSIFYEKKKKNWQLKLCLNLEKSFGHLNMIFPKTIIKYIHRTSCGLYKYSFSGDKQELEISFLSIDQTEECNMQRTCDRCSTSHGAFCSSFTCGVPVID